jgi:hypothetical protein
MKRPVATRPAAQAAVKAVQPAGSDHFMKLRREKRLASVEGAAVVDGAALPEDALSLASVMDDPPMVFFW